MGHARTSRAVLRTGAVLCPTAERPHQRLGSTVPPAGRRAGRYLRAPPPTWRPNPFGDSVAGRADICASVRLRLRRYQHFPSVPSLSLAGGPAPFFFFFFRSLRQRQCPPPAAPSIESVPASAAVDVDVDPWPCVAVVDLLRASWRGLSVFHARVGFFFTVVTIPTLPTACCKEMN